MQPFRDGVGVPAGRGGELGGSPGRGCQPDHRVAGGLPGIAGGPKGAGLAGAGGGDQRRDLSAVAGEPGDGVFLIGVQPGRGDMALHVGGRDDGPPSVQPGERGRQDPPLDRQLGRGGPAGVGLATGDATADDTDAHRLAIIKRCGGQPLHLGLDHAGRERSGRHPGGDLCGQVGAGEHRGAGGHRSQCVPNHPVLTGPVVAWEAVAPRVVAERGQGTFHRAHPLQVTPPPLLFRGCVRCGGAGDGGVQIGRGPAVPVGFVDPVALELAGVGVGLGRAGLQHRRLHHAGAFGGGERSAEVGLEPVDHRLRVGGDVAVRLDHNSTSCTGTPATSAWPCRFGSSKTSWRRPASSERSAAW